MYIKRQTISKAWPIPRKGTRYTIVPGHNKSAGIPLLIIIREILKIVQTRKELKKVLLEKKILVNNSVVKVENFSLCLFDTLSIKDAGKHYRLSYSETKKIILEEINEKESNFKICKVLGKKILKGKKVQINLNGGRNLISNEQVNISDSVLVNFNANKIEKIIPLEENSEVLVIKGKYLGQKGKIKKIHGEQGEITLKGREIKMNLKNAIALN